MAARKRKSPTPRKSKNASSRKSRELTDDRNWIEVFSIILGGLGLLHFLALISFNPYDVPPWAPLISRHAGLEEPSGNFIGPAGALWAGYSFFFLGAATYLLPAIMIWFAVANLMGFRILNWKMIMAVLVCTVSAASLVDMQPFFFKTWVEDYNLPGSRGGLVGYTVSQLTIGPVLGPVGSGVLMGTAYVISLIVITGLHPFEFIALVRRDASDWFARKREAREERLALLEKEEKEVRKATARDRTSRKPARKKEVEEEEEDTLFRSRRAEDEDEEDRPAPTRKRGRRKKAEPEPEEDPTPAMEEEAPKTPEPKIIDGTVRKSRGELSGTLADQLGTSFTDTGEAFKNYQLPSLDLLEWEDEEEDVTTNRDELLEMQRNIVDTLETFKVKVTPGDITRGPTITRYEVYPAKGLSVKSIPRYEADIARATRAERINILAPIPGKDTVGIEIANSNKVLVPLRELLEDPAFLKGKAQIPLALGKDVYGKVVVADLAAMPHLLVAGATGSGKSVCINSIIASLLYRFTPEELRFIMIDPKVVEMQMYNALPHLAVPVVTQPKKVLLALRWCLNEMERRYELFARVGVRKLEEFNKRHQRKARKGRGKGRGRAQQEEAPEESGDVLANAAGPDGLVNTEEVFMRVNTGDRPEEPREEQPELLEPQEDADVPEKLPYVVVIIDELADLMQTAPADVETAIARLCQKARAAGIHLIVATQSPRADVVTGLIKANIPARIAFQVASATDSRVIMDKAGAEKLVGKGDMLYQPPDSAVNVRSQGAFITDEECQDIVDHCARQAEPVFEQDIQDTLEGGDEEATDVSDEDEEILDKCIEVIIAEGKASTSFLQRRLRLGYTRAARMMDILEERGVVGPGDGAKPREILVAQAGTMD